MSRRVIDVKGAAAVVGGGSLACAGPLEHLREVFRTDIDGPSGAPPGTDPNEGWTAEPTIYK
jgi:hypothetical protein